MASDLANLGMGIPGPLGLDQKHLAPQQTTLTVRERRGWEGDTFEVKTPDGSDLLTVKSKLATMRGRKNVFGADGTHLFDLKKHLSTLQMCFYFEDLQETRFVEMVKKFAWAHNNFEIVFRNGAAGGEDVRLELRASFNDKSAEIVWNGVVVATLRRDFHLIRSRDTYVVHVAKGVDMVLMACICVLVDEAHDRDKRRGTAF